jgi:hypothetical protein
MPDHPSSTPPVTEPTAEELAHALHTLAETRGIATPGFYHQCARALERLTLAEEQRDASATIYERLRQAAHKLALYSQPPTDLTLSMSWGIERRKRQDELDNALSAFCLDFDERHRANGKPHA